MYEQCDSNPYSYYYDIFVKQFLQTLGQLSAGLLTSTLAIPVYSYYVRRNTVQKKNEPEESDDSDIEELNEQELENDKGYQGDSDSDIEELNDQEKNKGYNRPSDSDSDSE